MARTPSNMLALGTQAPEFNLIDVRNDQLFTFQDLKGSKATIIVFICNHCPFVHHVIDEFVAIAGKFSSKGISAVAISSNDVLNYPDDSPELMKVFAQKHNFDFPYLYDETQQTAKDYDAACTPDFYVFDSESKLAYRGQMDGSRPGNGIPVTGEDLRKALVALVIDEPIDSMQKPSLGCNIKWKP